jgi:hypothetical protein
MSAKARHSRSQLSDPTTKISEDQASPAEIQITCLPIDDRTLADHAKSVHVAIQMAHLGEVGSAQQGLRAIITAISRTKTTGAASEEKVHEIACQRQAIMREKGMSIYAGIGSLDVDGDEILVLVVYCALPAVDFVTVSLPIGCLCPTFRSAVH